MVTINLNIDNMSYGEILKEIFKGISDEYELTEKMVFRRKIPPKCDTCGEQMTHNGYNRYSKNKLGMIKVGRCLCPNCGHNFEEDKSFWEEMKNEFFSAIGKIVLSLAEKDLSLEGMVEVLENIFPRSKTWIVNLINDFLDELPEEIFIRYPSGNDCVFIHYDEQYLKVNGKQKYRLTLLNQNGEVIGEQLFNFLTAEAIFFFFCEYLDPTQRTFIVTDCDPTYPSIFEAFFGKNYIHQLCLFHLNKLIVSEFPKNGTVADEYMKYRFLNIFYDREKELAFIKTVLDEEVKVRADINVDYQRWLKRARRKIRRYIHGLKKARRRAGENLPQRKYKDARKKMLDLLNEYNDLPEHLQKRLKMIAKNWKAFTAFYQFKAAPGTNNRIENYYSRSVKTHHKKQFRSDIGVEIRRKLTILKINGFFAKTGSSLLDIHSKFQPFQVCG